MLRSWTDPAKVCGEIEDSMGAMNEVMDSFHKNSTWNNWYYIRKESRLLDIKWVFIMKMILFIRKSQIQS